MANSRSGMPSFKRECGCSIHHSRECLQESVRKLSNEVATLRTRATQTSDYQQRLDEIERLTTERSDLIKSIREILVRPSLSALHRANNKLPDELKIAELRELGFVEDLVSGTESP